MTPFDVPILISILLISAVVFYKRLDWGFYLLLFLVPFMHKEVFSIVIWDLLPIRIALLGAIPVFGLILLKHLKNQPKAQRFTKIIDQIKHDPFLLLMGLLWIIRALSIFRFFPSEDSLALFSFYTLVIFMYVVFRYVLSSYGESFFQKSLMIYMSLGIFTGIFAVIQYYLRLCCRYTIGGIWVVPGYTPRLGAWFWDVNHFGGFLITLIPIYFAYMFISKGRKKTLFLIGTVFLMWLLFMTQSRSAWIGLSVGMLLSFGIYYWNELKKPILIVALGVLLSVASLIAYTSFQGISIRDRVSSYMHYRLDSTDTHVMLLEGAAEIFFNNFYLGSGYGTFDRAFRQTDTANYYFDREPKLKDMKVPPHSVWGEVLGETGGAGVTLYTLIASVLVASLIATVFKDHDKNTRYLGIGVLGSVMSIFISGIFYSYNIEFYWITVFLAIGYMYKVWNMSINYKEIMDWWYSQKITPYILILPIAAFYIFIRLGSTSLIDWDEAIYAKVSKNILMTGDWLNLRWDDLNEFWFEKPPLYMWLTAMFFKVTNFNSWGARMTSALFGLSGIVLVYKFGIKLFNKLTGLFAALVLLSTVHYLYYSRNGMLDITVSFFIVATLYFFYLAMESYGRSRNINMLLAGIALGLGVMTKAVIGLLPLPVMIIYLSYLRFAKKELLPVKPLVYMLLSALFIAAPWHIYSIAVHGQKFYNKYFIDHILGRGLSGLGHEQPPSYFFNVIKVSFRIWLIPLFFGTLVLPFYDKSKRREIFLLLASIACVLLFFTLSKDKLQWYIVPIYPFMALVAARFMERFVYYANSVLIKEVRFDAKVVRVISLFCVYLVSIFYVVLMRERIYYPDFNKDKVALIKIFNQLYPIEDHPDMRLYYTNIAPPVLLFYSDHKISAVSKDGILTQIDEAQPAENKMFLIPEGLYYDLLDEQGKIKAPLVLDVKGAAGEWILVQSNSRVDVLKSELADILPELRVLEGKSLSKLITKAEIMRLRELEKRYTEITTKLMEYGVSPY